MFSFFATAVGSWCLVSPSQFAVYTGILGLAMYAFASGIPVLIVSLCGEPIRRMHPDVSSIADFAGKRFGPIMRTIVSAATASPARDGLGGKPGSAGHREGCGARAATRAASPQGTHSVQASGRGGQH